MPSRAKLHPVVLLTIAGLLTPAAAGAASDGGGGLRPSGGRPGRTGGSPPSSSGPVTQPATGSIQTSGNGFTVATRPVALLRSRLRFSGTVSGAQSGAVVQIERRGRQTGGAWAATTRARVQPDGSFTAIWPTDHIGRFTIRAVLQGSAASASRAGMASPSLIVTVYRPAIATTFGPGFWGSRTACGQILRRNTLGVANRTLPCGTPVSLLWHGRTIVVPVIDRGPYANHADWDLTTATAQALHMDGTETIGAVSLPR